MQISIIITTYNAAKWLEKVLYGYGMQTISDFEIIIADDGSTEETKEVIAKFQNYFTHPIVHVWHEDKGFRKCKIVNKAILEAKSDYILFTDGDCIPRKDFVATHLKQKEKGYLLSGGYFKLPMNVSESIEIEHITTQKCFSIKWLIQNGVAKSFKVTKLTKNLFFAWFMNWITPTKKTFNGHNTSCYKSDLLAVNGFNEEMQYGGLDRELGERLFNNGVFAKQIRYTAICIHLDHKRGYNSPEIWKKNNAIREFNRKNKVTFIEKGIIQ